MLPVDPLLPLDPLVPLPEPVVPLPEPVVPLLPEPMLPEPELPEPNEPDPDVSPLLPDVEPPIVPLEPEPVVLPVEPLLSPVELVPEVPLVVPELPGSAELPEPVVVWPDDDRFGCELERPCARECSEPAPAAVPVVAPEPRPCCVLSVPAPDGEVDEELEPVPEVEPVSCDDDPLPLL